MQLDMMAMAPETLPDFDDAMETGPMGDCVSVIVLWNLDETRYADVRGWHGLGGIGAIDFDALFADVPDVVSTQVIIVASRMGGVGMLLDDVHERVAWRLPTANIRVCKGFANASVDRAGLVQRI